MHSPRILIVRPGALGDTILTIPLLDTLCHHLPNAHITFLGNRRYRALIPPAIEFHAFDAPEWLWVFARDEADLGANARPFDRAYVILTKEDEVVRNLRRAGTKDVLHATARPPQGEHVVAHLHESFGFAVPKRRPALENMAPQEKKDTIWVHPGSGGSSKCIPLCLMVSLAWKLRARTGYTVTVTMAEEDAFLTTDPAWESLAGDGGTVVLANLSLRDLCREAGAARLFLGNDSGVSHLAGALGVPSTIFFVRTDPDTWAPWADDGLSSVVDLRGQDPAGMNVDRQAQKILDRFKKICALSSTRESE
jgi:heptosyltransferase III